MSQPITIAATRPRLSRGVRELTGDILLALIWMFFAWRFLTAFLTSYRPQDALLLLLQCVTVAMFLTRRHAQTSSSDIGDWVAALCGTFTPLFFYPQPWTLAPALGMLFDLAQAFGTCVAVFGLLWLRGSFGIVPANRGVRATGLYRYIRHPIYAGYILSYLAFTAANPSVRNIVVLLADATFQIVRIGNEEHYLKRDPEYREYVTRTRWRLFPFLY